MYIGDLAPLALDGVAEVFLDHAHGGDGVGAEGLDDLQGGHQAVVVDLLEDGVEFVAGLLEDFGARCEVCQRGRVELWFFRSVFCQGLDSTGGVVGGGV